MDKRDARHEVENTENPLPLDYHALERIHAYIERVEGAANAVLQAQKIEKFEKMVDRFMRERFGHGVYYLGNGVATCTHHTKGTKLQRLLATIWTCLKQIETAYIVDLRTGSDYFATQLNKVLSDEEIPVLLVDGQWHPSAESKADRILLDVLRDIGEVASCTQGDPQVEIVSASVHDRLNQENVTIVDYGAGLGRMGDGLSASAHFAKATFIAVDEPIQPDLERFVSALPNGRVMNRSEYLRQRVAANVVLMVNTLHHIPFRDLGEQLAAVLLSLEPKGALVVHELGEFPKQEKLNVPWSESDIVNLFSGDEFSVNPRTAKSRSGRSLPHVHVCLTRPVDPGALQRAIAANAQCVWQAMKSRVLGDIRGLYAAAPSEQDDALVRLRTALVVNANLDLNHV